MDAWDWCNRNYRKLSITPVVGANLSPSTMTLWLHRLRKDDIQEWTSLISYSIMCDLQSNLSYGTVSNAVLSSLETCNIYLVFLIIICDKVLTDNPKIVSHKPILPWSHVGRTIEICACLCRWPGCGDTPLSHQPKAICQQDYASRTGSG